MMGNGDGNVAGGNSEEGRIVTETCEHVLLIGIDRPRKYNAFGPKLLREMAEAYSEFESDPGYRCAVVHAKGANFTAGFDLRQVEITGEVFPPGLVDPLDLRPPFRSKPVVIAVHGICFTLGVELALAADIVVAADDTRFAQLEVKRGLVSFGGATFRMVERAGWGNAMRYLLTGDEFDAATALRLGFIQEVVEPGAQLSRALEIAEAIARQAPLAVRAMRQSSRTALVDGQTAAIERFPELVSHIKGTRDFQEGIQSFLEKREPLFEGR